MPEMVLSSSFLLHFRSLFPSPSAVVEYHSSAPRYIFKPKSLVLWYLVLKAFTQASFPTWNCLALVFKVR